MDLVKIVMTIVTQNKLNVYQIDVKSTFLNDNIEGEVYVEKTQHYEISGQEHQV